MTFSIDGNNLEKQIVYYIKSSFENLSQEKTANAIDLQPKVMEALVASNDGHTNYLSCG